MNLLKDPFISTNLGKVSLRDILTSDTDYQLQYFFDEIQLAMLQMLASLTTLVLKPTIAELKGYLASGITAEQYDAALSKIETKWFEGDSFMQSKSSGEKGFQTASVSKLISGIEFGDSKDASGLFSDADKVSIACSDCIHVLNYNLHMNISGQYFGSYGATGIRGGGVLTTLISGKSLKETILFNTVAIDFYDSFSALNESMSDLLMWEDPPQGKLYSASEIGLSRGLFALAYHIKLGKQEGNCVCDICGAESGVTYRTLDYLKYNGKYGSVKTDKGKENGAGLWLHPYTPRSVSEKGVFSLVPIGLTWSSWQDLSSLVIEQDINDNSNAIPSYIVTQFRENFKVPINLIIGGNITKKASVVSRVYDLYSMPSTLSKNNSRISVVVEAGLAQKEGLSHALNKMFGIGYDKNFVSGIKDQVMQRFVANAQQIIQQILLDVDRKEAAELRTEAISALNKEAKTIFKAVQRKYQHDLSLFKALVKGESALYKTQ